MTLQLFKWMMALAVMLYLPLLFEQVKSIRRQDRKHSDEYIKERVESIWFDVTHFYNQLQPQTASPQGEGLEGEPADLQTGGETTAWRMPDTWPDFDRLYCSEAWNRCVAEFDEQADVEADPVSARESSQRGNYWLGASNGQVEFLYVNKVEVIDRTGDHATVSLKLHNGNRAVPVLLVMTFERNDWHIDNMTYYWNEKPSTRYYDWRQEMEVPKK